MNRPGILRPGTEQRKRNFTAGGEEKRYWLDDRRNVKKVVYALCAVCGLLLAVDPLVHKHGPFAVEHWLGFYSIFGFVAPIALVIAANRIRRILIRPEDYYDD